MPDGNTFGKEWTWIDPGLSADFLLLQWMPWVPNHVITITSSSRCLHRYWDLWCTF